VNFAARLAIASALTLSLAGCHAGAATRAGSATKTGSGTKTGSPAGGTANRSGDRAAASKPACFVGAWRSDGFTVDTTSANATGGDGFTMKINPAGQTVVDFAGMRPVTITVTFGGSAIHSHLMYAGKVSGKLKLPPANATTGPWTSEGGADWSSLRVTIDIDGSKIFDNASPADIAKEYGSSSSTVTSSDTQPVLGTGTYTCAGDKLTVQQQGRSAAAIWTLHREA
jgi:hypothetical protein